MPKQENDFSKEKELILKIQAGDVKLFNFLIQKYQKEVFKMVLSILNHFDDTEDIVQESFVRAYLHIKKFKFLSSFKTWLFSITFNLIRDYFKRKKYTITFNEKVATRITHIFQQDTIKTHLVSDLMNNINHEISNFSDMQKLIFNLRIQQEKPIKEIAHYLNIKEGTVKSHIHRIFTKLRRKYSKTFNLIFKEYSHEF